MGSKKNIQIALFSNPNKEKFLPSILVQLKEKNQLIRFGDISRALEIVKGDYEFLVKNDFETNYPSLIKSFALKKKKYSVTETKEFLEVYSFLENELDSFLSGYSFDSIQEQDFSNLLIRNLKVFISNKIDNLNSTKSTKLAKKMNLKTDSESSESSGSSDIEIVSTEDISSKKLMVLKSSLEEKEKTLGEYLATVKESKLLHEDKDILEMNIYAILSLVKANLDIQVINSYEQLERFKSLEEKIDRGIENIDEKLNFLLEKKQRRINQALPLREGMNFTDFKLIISNAGLDRKNNVISYKNSRIRIIQLKIIYSLLFYFGLRLNETMKFTYEMFEYLWENHAISLVLSKTNKSIKQPISKQGKQAFLELKPLIEELYKEHNFTFLGCSGRYPNKLMKLSNYRSFVNTDLECTWQKLNLPKYTSHSFRIGYITSLLAKGQVQQVAKLIGHKSVQTTMLYYRFTEDESIQQILNDSFQSFQ